MEKIKQVLPQNFEIINGINYFRLEDGQIAVEKTSNVTINSSKEDIVELITLVFNSNIVKFWRTNNKLYALASSCNVIIPEEVTFVDCYSSSNYPEGKYVKYMSSGKCGIIYVSETEVSIVISHEYGSIDICFDENIFYLEQEEDENKHHVIDEAGRLLRVFPSKCRKLDGYMLFYDDSSIFIKSSKFNIIGGISSLEVVKQGKITFVKVINENGIYYYTKEINYLFGPIKKDQIHGINDESCLVYELVENKVVQVFYINITKDICVCEHLFNERGIECHEVGYKSTGGFFVADSVVYVLQDKKFVPIIKGVDANKYVIHVNEMYLGARYIIVGYQENKPVYLAYYDSSISKKEVYDEGTLELISDGYKDPKGIVSHICRKGEYIVVISHDGNVVLYVKGQNCSKKEYCGQEVYFIEEPKNKIAIYRKDGKQV